MSSFVRAMFVVLLLAVPLLVVTEMPHVFEFIGTAPTNGPTPSIPTPVPAFSLVDSTPTTPAPASHIASLNTTPPPTLEPPVATATGAPTARPTATGERVIIGNTGGLGAVLRSDPVTGRPVGALRDRQVLDVLERRNVPGGGDWVHVRTSDGLEGWVTGLVAQPAPQTTP